MNSINKDNTTSLRGQVVHVNDDNQSITIDELKQLSVTLGYNIIDSFIQKRNLGRDFFYVKRMETRRNYSII